MIYVKAYDGWMLFIVMALTGFGALMVYSSTSVVTPALNGMRTSEFHYIIKYLLTALIGLVAMSITYRVRLEFLKKAAIPLLVLSLFILLLVFLPGIGVSAGGARRWIRLWPLMFQPSELVKLAMVIFMAWYMSASYYRPDRFGYFIIPILIMGVFQFVFMKQPDFGTTISLGVLTVAMLYLSGAKLWYILSLLLLSAPLVVKLLMEPYRFRRLTTFLNPWEHAQDSGFQLVQSFLAFGSGGLTGVGLGNSRQKLDYLPEVHTDFIFSMVGEELGFFVASLIVMLFALLFWRGVSVARRSTDKFSYYLAFGLSMMIAFQALMNFCVVTGLLPTKGLPLPFLSYGGSSLLINMLAIGLLLNLSRPKAECELERINLDDLIRRKKARRHVYGERQ